MKGEATGDWPLDLRIFALACVVWAAALAVRVFAQSGIGRLSDTIQAVIFGYKLYGLEARLVLLLQASIYASIGVGMIGRKRWALVVALLYFSQVVIGHLVFVLAYLGVPGQELHVKIAGFEGPGMVLILLYLWIRVPGSDLHRRAARAILTEPQIG